MNINKQELPEAATKAMLEEGLTWWDEGQLKDGVVLHQADAAFVAIASPDTVLALLDELESAEKRVAEQREEIARLETMADNAHDALSAVLESGEVMNLHVINTLRRGLNNQPVHAAACINGEG